MVSNETKITEFEEFIKSKGPWDLWASVTFHERTELVQARGSFKYFLKHLNSPDDIFLISSCFALSALKEKAEGVFISTLLLGEFIIVDECHRSIYNLWKQVLDYFDGFLIGLTATPSKSTIAFFNKNLDDGVLS